MKYSYIFLLFIVSCTNHNIDNLNNSTLYSDYDVFKRKGIKEIDKENITLPFIQEYLKTDSTIHLRIYTNSLEIYDEAIIPKTDGFIIYSQYDYMDNPNQIFGTIKGNKVIRYGYTQNPYWYTKDEGELISLHEIVPNIIEVYEVNKYNCYFYNPSNFNERGSYMQMKNKIIFPFNIDLSKLKSTTVWIKETEDSLFAGGNSRPKYFKKFRWYLNPSRRM